ncbi:hypothetical protein BX616_004674 [Lobosporangium transversale]|nr:hypothetical protein BX616_004674 [Lobosporangium transversale]
MFIKRSLNRTAWNGATIPAEDSAEFMKLGIELLDDSISVKQFEATVTSIRVRFKKIGPWIDWYLNPSRGKLLFPALRDIENPKLSDNTNAQEGIGNDFKTSSGEKNLSILSASLPSPKEVESIENVNDGRPPELGAPCISSKKKRIGRPRGSRNKAPMFWSKIELSIIGTPWGISYKKFAATNSCPLDTTLMIWYLLHRSAGIELPMHVRDKPRNISNTKNVDKSLTIGGIFQNIVAAITRGEHHRARWLFCIELLNMSPEGQVDLFGSIDKTFLEPLKDVFSIQWRNRTTCSFKHCPKGEKDEEEDAVTKYIEGVAQGSSLTQDIIRSFGVNDTISPCNHIISSSDAQKIGAEKLEVQDIIDIDGRSSSPVYSCPGFRSTMEKSKALHYNGMAANKLEWVDLPNISPNYLSAEISHIWYYKVEATVSGDSYELGTDSCSQDSDSSEATREEEVEQSWQDNLRESECEPDFGNDDLDDLAHIDKRRTIENDAGEPVRESMNLKEASSKPSSQVSHRNRPQYPIGICVREISRKGRAPTRACSEQTIDRSERRLTVLRIEAWECTSGTLYKLIPRSIRDFAY